MINCLPSLLTHITPFDHTFPLTAKIINHQELKIWPKAAVQVKKATLRGTLTLHLLFQGIDIIHGDNLCPILMGKEAEFYWPNRKGKKKKKKSKSFNFKYIFQVDLGWFVMVKHNLIVYWPTCTWVLLMQWVLHLTLCKVGPVSIHWEIVFYVDIRIWQKAKIHWSQFLIINKRDVLVQKQ